MKDRDPRLDAMDALRRRIDELDESLVRLLNERAACALAIGDLKQVLGLQIYQPDREREVLRHVRAASGGPLDEGAVGRLFERIIDEARRLERVSGAGSGRHATIESPPAGTTETGAARREEPAETGVESEESGHGRSDGRAGE